MWSELTPLLVVTRTQLVKLTALPDQTSWSSWTWWPLSGGEGRKGRQKEGREERGGYGREGRRKKEIGPKRWAGCAPEMRLSTALLAGHVPDYLDIKPAKIIGSIHSKIDYCNSLYYHLHGLWDCSSDFSWSSINLINCTWISYGRLSWLTSVFERTL